MSNDTISEIVDTKAEKPVKRVRFSDEVQTVFNDEESEENQESNSLENESSCTMPVDKLETHDIDVDYENDFENDDSINDSDDLSESLSEKNPDNFYELPSQTSEEIDVQTKSISDDISAQKYDNSSDNVKYILSSGQRNDMDELINDTMQMTISPSRSELLSDNIFAVETSLDSSVPNNDNSQNEVEPSQQINATTNLSRKRSLEGNLIKKQTSKLNTCLRKNSTEVSSANELKNAVFNAWYKVKNEKIQPPNTTSEMKKINTSQTAISHGVRNPLNRSKRAVKKISPTKKISPSISESVVHKSETDLEESKMAFQAWKKKKDELLKHQLAEKYKKEEKKRLDSLLRERLRKTDAESAYSAWNAHKAVYFQKEKKKHLWLLEKEKEKLEEKMKKNEDAEKIYFDWLRNKMYHTKHYAYKSVDDKPPWTPPGIANSPI